MRTQFLVLGGGITGLAFAQALRGQDYLVCEALPDVGGYCQTIKQDGFVWDYSGHFFHFRYPAIERELVTRIGPERVHRVQRRAQIHIVSPSGEVSAIEFPFQKNIHQLPRADFLDCLVDLVQAERATGQSPPSNFKEMLIARYGRAISERFLIPYNEKLYATDLTSLDVEAMGRFFPHVNATEVILGFRAPKDTGYNATFTYPEGGAIEYVRAIERDLDPARLLLGEPILSIDPRRRRVKTPRREIEFEYLVSCAPFPKLLELAQVPHDSRAFTWNKVLVFNLGFDTKGPRDVHWMYFPSKDLSFYRVGFYDNILPGALSTRMSLYVELGFPGDAPLDPRAIAHARGRVLEDLRRTSILTSQQLIAEHHVVLDPAYVHITKTSIEAVRRLKEALATRGIHSIGRYGSWTYCSIEDNIVEARNLAERFLTLC